MRPGFIKLHLDTSMGCRGEDRALRDAITAARAAELALVAEAATNEGPRPCYVIGTEMPIPDGAFHALDDLAVTDPVAARRTVKIHHEAFGRVGAGPAFDRAVGGVVHPGVKFGNADLIPYRRELARELSAALALQLRISFEMRLLCDGLVGASPT